jgi:hypothetical protein
LYIISPAARTYIPATPDCAVCSTETEHVAASPGPLAAPWPDGRVERAHAAVRQSSDPSSLRHERRLAGASSGGREHHSLCWLRTGSNWPGPPAGERCRAGPWLRLLLTAACPGPQGNDSFDESTACISRRPQRLENGWQSIRHTPMRIIGIHRIPKYAGIQHDNKFDETLPDITLS